MVVEYAGKIIGEFKFRSKADGFQETAVPGMMGVAWIFFVGEHIFKKFVKKFSKNFQKIFKNFQKNSKNFRKFLKFFLRKLLKMYYFSISFSQVNKAGGQFLRVWTKNASCRNFLRKFWKFPKVCLRKLWKMHYFSRFFTKFKKLCVDN